jgi:hypothetical protein
LIARGRDTAASASSCGRCWRARGQRAKRAACRCARPGWLCRGQGEGSCLPRPPHAAGWRGVVASPPPPAAGTADDFWAPR